MELWFIAGLGAALGSGLSAFIIKMAAKRNYSSEVFILYSGVFSVILFLPIAIIFSGTSALSINLAILALGTGLIASTVGVFKVYALRYIDTTIYYPLFKLVSPALAIVFGVVFFAERFSSMEWVGLSAGLMVPLLLITRSEKVRQNNLTQGLILVVVTGVLAAIISALNKYAIDIYNAALWIVAFNSLGIVAGSFAIVLFKQGPYKLISHFKKGTNKYLLFWASARSVVISLGFLSFLYAFSLGGTLGIVYTVQSFYILIPIILAILIYKEHWNIQKVVAVVLSVASLAFLG